MRHLFLSSAALLCGAAADAVEPNQLSILAAEEHQKHAAHAPKSSKGGEEEAKSKKKSGPKSSVGDWFGGVFDQLYTDLVLDDLKGVGEVHKKKAEEKAPAAKKTPAQAPVEKDKKEKTGEEKGFFGGLFEEKKTGPAKQAKEEKEKEDDKDDVDTGKEKKEEKDDDDDDAWFGGLFKETKAKADKKEDKHEKQQKPARGFFASIFDAVVEDHRKKPHEWHV